MRNIKVQLKQLLDVESSIQLQIGIITKRISVDQWEVQSHGITSTVLGDNVIIGEYVVYDRIKIIENLGEIDFKSITTIIHSNYVEVP